MIGAAIGCGALMPRGPLKAGFKALWEQRAYFLVILLMANLPDIDYVPGVLMGEINAFHHWYTHTLGWIAVVSLAVWILWRKTHRAGWSVFAVLFAALASHLAVDLFSADHSVPYGIMALWPFSDAHYKLPWPILRDVWRHFSVEATIHNLISVAWEIAVLLPILLITARVTLRRGH